MATNKYIASGASFSGDAKARVDKYKSLILSDLNSFELFKNLRKVSGIENMCIGLMSKETSLIPMYISPWSKTWIIKSYIPQTWSARTIFQITNSTYQDIIDEKLIWEILLPHGLGQVMGWNFCQDLVFKKKSWFEKDFAKISPLGGGSFVCSSKSAPGTINNLFNGTNGEANQIRAMLVMLNSKFETALTTVKSDKAALSIAIKSYLGTGKDAFGTTPEKYLADISGLADKPKIGRSTTSARQTVASTNGSQTKPNKPACPLT